MADITSNPPTVYHGAAYAPDERPARRPVGRRRSGEFHVYFTLIFILAIPVGIERYFAAIIRKRSLDTRGPIARAWAEADRVTPLIFQR